MYLISYLLQVDVDNFPSAECTSKVRITYPTTPAPTTTTVTTKPTTPTPTPPPVICTQPLDIYFAIDTSGSLVSVEFMDEIDFVIQIIDSFTSSNNRYGYLIFANDTTSTELVSDSDAVKERLMSTPYRGGSNINAARAALNNIVRVACPGKLLSTCIWYTEVYFSIVAQILLIIDCIYSNLHYITWLRQTMTYL